MVQYIYVFPVMGLLCVQWKAAILRNCSLVRTVRAPRKSPAFHGRDQVDPGREPFAPRAGHVGPRPGGKIHKRGDHQDDEETRNDEP